ANGATPIVLTYQWTSEGRMKKLIDGAGHWTTYGYDDVGRRNLESDGLGTTIWTYETGTARVHTKQDPAGTVALHTYDPAGRLNHVEYADAPGVDATPSRDFLYTWLGQVRVATRNDPTGSHAVNLTYDSLGRKLSESI